MKTQTTPYYELAERIANNIEGHWYCCTDLPSYNASKFKILFRPTESELKEYGHVWEVWMAQHGLTEKQDNEFRILALLFMHEMTVNP